jgi:hypothetical protein
VPKPRCSSGARRGEGVRTGCDKIRFTTKGGFYETPYAFYAGNFGWEVSRSPAIAPGNDGFRAKALDALEKKSIKWFALQASTCHLGIYRGFLLHKSKACRGGGWWNSLRSKGAGFYTRQYSIHEGHPCIPGNQRSDLLLDGCRPKRDFRFMPSTYPRRGNKRKIKTLSPFPIRGRGRGWERGLGQEHARRVSMLVA